MTGTTGAHMSVRQDGGFSGPHVCAQVGSETIGAVRAVLLDACARNGGRLDAHDIEYALDLITSLPEFYGVFQRGFSHCAHLHENPIPNLSDRRALGRYLVQAYCRDVALRVFKRQVKEFGPGWLGHFVDGLLAWVGGVDHGSIVEQLQERYRIRAVQDGTALTLGELLTDPGIVRIVAEAVEALRAITPSDFDRMETTINRHISDAYGLDGPSIAKLNDMTFGLFLRRLSTSNDRNQFRMAVNAQIPD